jgi:hypothetical protein
MDFTAKVMSPTIVLMMERSRECESGAADVFVVLVLLAFAQCSPNLSSQEPGRPVCAVAHSTAVNVLPTTPSCKAKASRKTFNRLIGVSVELAQEQMQNKTSSRDCVRGNIRALIVTTKNCSSYEAEANSAVTLMKYLTDLQLMKTLSAADDNDNEDEDEKGVDEKEYLS